MRIVGQCSTDCDGDDYDEDDGDGYDDDNAQSILSHQVFTGRGLHGMSNWSGTNHRQVSCHHGCRGGGQHYHHNHHDCHRHHDHLCHSLNYQDEDERPSSVVPGNALVVDPKLPYRPKIQNSLMHP